MSDAFNPQIPIPEDPPICQHCGKTMSDTSEPNRCTITLHANRCEFFLKGAQCSYLEGHEGPHAYRVSDIKPPFQKRPAPAGSDASHDLNIDVGYYQAGITRIARELGIRSKTNLEGVLERVRDLIEKETRLERATYLHKSMCEEIEKTMKGHSI